MVMVDGTAREFAGLSCERQLPGISFKQHPETEVLGVPQRTFGYVNSETKERQGVDKLQTTNLITCVAVAGHNSNGAFLAHLDRMVAYGASGMMWRIATLLGEGFNTTIVSSSGFGAEEYQMYLPDLRAMLRKYSASLKEYTKSGAAVMGLGITMGGELFHPMSHVKHDALYGRENEFFTNGMIPPGLEPRVNLSCINNLERLAD